MGRIWRRRAWNAVMRGLLWLSAAVTCVLVVFLVCYLFFRGVPSLSWAFLTSEESVLKGTNGILPAMANTVYVALVSLAVCLPLGVGAAVYLNEYARSRKAAAVVEFAVEILAGIPSILYALVGLLVFSQFLGLQKTLLAASLTLGVMNLPVIIRTTQESLKTVPQNWREGALGLGAGRWRMIRTVVLPGAVDGIATGCILAIGRIVGESAVLLYIAGMGTAMNDFLTAKGFFSASGATLTTMLYLYAKERADFGLAFAVAVVLMVFTLLMNLAADLAAGMVKKR